MSVIDLGRLFHHVAAPVVTTVSHQKFHSVVRLRRCISINPVGEVCQRDDIKSGCENEDAANGNHLGEWARSAARWQTERFAHSEHNHDGENMHRQPLLREHPPGSSERKLAR